MMLNKKHILSSFLFLTILLEPFVAESNTYKRILRNDPLSFDPAALFDIVSLQVAHQMTEGLVKNEKNLIRPGLAKKWEISKDLRKYTFYLRDDIRYSDGTKITAEDFIFAFENLLRSGRQISQDVSIIKGYEDFIGGKAKSISGVKKLSDTALVIEIDEPFSPFLDVLSSIRCVVLSKKSLSKLKNDPVSIIETSGPYRISEIQKGKRYKLVKNPHYYDSKNVFFEEIVYEIVSDETQAVEGLIKGMYHDIWPYDVTLEKLKNSKFRFVEVPSLTAKSTFLSINLSRKITGNLKYRTFIISNIDIYGFLEELGLPLHYRSYGLIPRGMLGFKERKIEFKSPNVEELKEAGCVKGNPCQVDLLYRYKEDERALRRLLKPLDKYADYLRIKLLRLDNELWFKKFQSGDYSLMLTPNSASYGDPYLIINYLSDDTFSAVGFDRKRIAKLLAKARQVNNKVDRSKIYAQIDDIVMEELAIIPLYHGDRPYRVARSDIEGYFIPLLGYPYLRIKNLYLEK